MGKPGRAAVASGCCKRQRQQRVFQEEGSDAASGSFRALLSKAASGKQVGTLDLKRRLT